MRSKKRSASTATNVERAQARLLDVSVDVLLRAKAEARRQRRSLRDSDLALAETKRRIPRWEREISETLANVEERQEAFRWKVDVEVYRRARAAANAQSRPVHELDVIRATIAGQEKNALRAVKRALENDLDPKSLTQSGLQLYEEIAKMSGLSEREIFSYFKSPEQFGIAT